MLGWWRNPVKHVVRTVKKGYNYVAEKAKKLYSLAKGAYNRAKNTLTRYAKKLGDARHIFDRVKNAFKSGLKVVNYIRKHGIGGIINVQRLWFDVGLESASLGHFAGGIKLKFFGRYHLDLSVSFDLRKIANLAKQLFRKVLSNIKRIFG